MPTLDEISSIREELLPEAVDETTTEETEVVETVGTEDTTEDTTEESIEYFNELPEAMGWGAEEFYNLKLKADNGEVYTWSQIKDTIQQSKNKTEEFTAREAALTAKEHEVQQQAILSTQQAGPVTQAVQQAQQNMNTIEQAYNGTLASLEAMQQDDDTTGLVKAQSELLKLQNLHAQAQQQLNIASQEQQTLQQQNFLTYRDQQARQLATKLPVFNNPETRRTAVSDLKEYLLGEGIQPQEVSTLTDARSISLFYKAMQWDKHQQDVQKTAQSLRDGTVKRIVRGKHVTQKPSREKMAKVIAQAQTSHLERDKRAAFRAVAEDAGILNLGNS